jgi:hypothetical protein
MRHIPSDLYVLVFRHLRFEDLLNFCCTVRGFAEQFGANLQARDLFRLLWCDRSKWADSSGASGWPNKPCITNLIQYGPVRAAELIWRVFDIPSPALAHRAHLGYGPIPLHALHGCGVPALQFACANGLLLKAQWLTVHFGLQARHARTGENGALRAACRNGHQHVAAWLIVEFGLGAADISAVHDYAFRYACYNGHLAIVQLLAPALTRLAIRARNFDALKSVCLAGHLTILQWLVARFDVTRAMILEADCIMFRDACSHGHLGVAQWMADHFALGAAEARICRNWALRFACLSGRLAIVQWMVDRFALDAADARACKDWGLHRARIGGGPHTAGSWLVERFDL